jgi:hypothetical protein
MFDLPLTEAPGSTSLAAYGSHTLSPIMFGSQVGTVAWQPGQIGQAILTTNLAAYSSAPNTFQNYFTFSPGTYFNGLTNFTFDCLAKQGSFSTNACEFFYLSGSGYDPIQIFAWYGVELVVQLNETAFNQNFTSGAVADGNWHEWTVTYSGTNISVYLDSALLGTGAYSYPLTNALGNITLYWGVMHSGAQANTLFWSRCLSSNEVRSLHDMYFPP